jgi:hypothetical protein
MKQHRNAEPGLFDGIAPAAPARGLWTSTAYAASFSKLCLPIVIVIATKFSGTFPITAFSATKKQRCSS